MSSAPSENVAVHKPIVAIVGRQNVGKSSLLNRVAGKPLAIVEDMPGTTRDRIFADVSWCGVEFTLVDTGGLEPQAKTTIAIGVNEQIQAAISEADVIIFLVDTKDGLTPTDHEIAQMLRQVKKPLLLAANKADNPKLEAAAVEFYELSVGEPVPVSAYHGRGVAEMLDKVITLLPPATPIETRPELMKVAIVGQPNVGKSMLLNCLLGSKRVIVDETPGTTRDAIDTLFNFEGQSVLLIDTAGIRRRGRIEVGVEKYSVIRALRAIERADVVLLVLDASKGITAQDTHIAGYVHQATKGIVLVVNKWDLVKNKNKDEWDEHIRSQFKFVPYAPILYTSAILGQGVDRIIPRVLQIYQERLRRLPTATVNGIIQEAVAATNPPRKGGKQLRVLYVTQTDVNPPTFIFFVNDEKLVHFSYQRYLENKLRQSFGFTGTSIRMVFKARREP